MKPQPINVPVTMTVDLTVNGESVPWEPFEDERHQLRAELAAERAHADRLYEALRYHRAHDYTVDAALKAHDARREAEQ